MASALLPRSSLVHCYFPHDEIPGPVLVPADGSVRLDDHLQLIDYLREENRALNDRGNVSSAEDRLERVPDATIGDLIVAADCFTIKAWTRRGLQRLVILFFMELSTRKVEIAGIALGAALKRLRVEATEEAAMA